MPESDAPNLVPPKANASTHDDDAVPRVPNLQLPQLAFDLERATSERREQAQQQLKAAAELDAMAPYCEMLMAAGMLEHDSTLIKSLKGKNENHLRALQDKLDDARINLGESEVGDALRARATYLAQIGEKETAVAAHEEAIEQTPGLGTKIDLRLAMIRIGFFHGDHALISTNIEETQKLVDEGGDWDRRNRLKAYEGLHLLSVRNFKRGGQLLLDVLSTFTATELVEYDDFVSLCVLAGAFFLDRKDLKKKVESRDHSSATVELIEFGLQIIDAPEVIALIPNMPSLKSYCDSLWKCEYAAFFQALARVEETHLLSSRLLSPHARYYVREMRIKAYAQLLESYSSVTLSSLCQAFGVSEAFMDADLARFIAAGRLNCSIDRVNGIVTTNRPDSKNARYASVIKQGDVVLTAVQRLSRVIG
ncbi:proteasome regulatory particle subunit [Microbotryomycetes sp. JL201]|nr:proteasome regulatory particle subunit [Microbotryomycetes sp. JL201]